MVAANCKYLFPNLVSTDRFTMPTITPTRILILVLMWWFRSWINPEKIGDHFNEYFWEGNTPLSCYMYAYGILAVALVTFGLRVKRGEEAIANRKAVAMDRKKLEEDKEKFDEHMKGFEGRQKVRHVC